MAGKMETPEHIRLITKNKILNEFLVKKLKERQISLVSDDNEYAGKVGNKYYVLKNRAFIKINHSSFNGFIYFTKI